MERIVMEHNSEDIRNIQQIELKLLKSFVHICEQNHLRYYMMYGSLIGTVRHNGFIPWDDDIDVGMPREDYDRFIKIAPDLLPPNQFLQSPYTEKDYIFTLAKLRQSDTTYIERRLQYLRINQGLWLDIFCLDNTPTTWIERKRVNFFRRINDAAYYDAQKSEEERSNYSFIRKIAVRLLHILYPNYCWSGRRNDKLYRSIKFNGQLCSHDGIYGESIPVEWYGEGVNMNFEGITVKVPTNYDAVLKTIYGEYMKLPPEEQRVPRHDAVIIDLNKPYTQYFK